MPPPQLAVITLWSSTTYFLAYLFIICVSAFKYELHEQLVPAYQCVPNTEDSAVFVHWMTEEMSETCPKQWPVIRLGNSQTHRSL